MIVDATDRETLTALALGRQPRVGDYIRIDHFRDNTEFVDLPEDYGEDRLRRWIDKPLQGLNAYIVQIDWNRTDSILVRLPVHATMWVWPEDVEFYGN